MADDMASMTLPFMRSRSLRAQHMSQLVPMGQGMKVEHSQPDEEPTML
jgi:hypothetical protein